MQYLRTEPVMGGYTPAERFRAQRPDGSWVFVKRAVDEETATWLRTEARVYAALEGAPFLARCEDFQDGPLPVLVLEDLGAAHWPPPWRPGLVEAVCEALDAVAATVPPAWTPARAGTSTNGWWRVAADPAPFLGLRLCTAAWLGQHLPALIDAETPWPSPAVLTHCDTRSDNLCQVAGQVKLVDWNWICTAPAGLDRAFWSASLAAEGGAQPEDICGVTPLWAARVSGFFASVAGLPQIPTAPRVRHIQQVQLRTALPWVCRALALPRPTPAP